MGAACSAVFESMRMHIVAAATIAGNTIAYILYLNTIAIVWRCSHSRVHPSCSCSILCQARGSFHGRSV